MGANRKPSGCRAKCLSTRLCPFIAAGSMSPQPPDAQSWRQLNDHLDHGLELSPEEREQWLRELAGTDPALAQRLRELFAKHEGLSARGFLESPALQVLDDPSSLQASSMAGKRVGAYTI